MAGGRHTWAFFGTAKTGIESLVDDPASQSLADNFGLGMHMQLVVNATYIIVCGVDASAGEYRQTQSRANEYPAAGRRVFPVSARHIYVMDFLRGMTTRTEVAWDDESMLSSPPGTCSRDYQNVAETMYRRSHEG